MICAFCHKEIDEDKPFLRQGKFALCDEHVAMKHYRKKIFDLLKDITNADQIPLWIKVFSNLINQYSPRKFIYYLEDNREYLEKTLLKKDFTSEYGKCAYLKKILENNLKDYKLKDDQLIQKKIDEGDDLKVVRPKRPKKRSLQEILDGK